MSTAPVADAAPAQLERTFRAMACDVRIAVIGPEPGADAAVARAEEVFGRVEAACTRFDPASPLMLANAEGRRWHQVPAECYDAVTAAAMAHRDTDGLFDPRVLQRLEAYGYDRSLPFEAGQVTRPEGGAVPRRPRRQWRPGLDAERGRIRVGSTPIDLGGIGKGLAVRWAGAPLRKAGRATLIEAGGDCLALGRGPECLGWSIGVEDPFGGPDPVAVLALSDLGCATSSTRVRRWQVAGRSVHHLIDPRTGHSAASQLASVTVVDPDPARAEVWSKALFVAGHDRIAALCAERDLAAMWVQDDGRVRVSRRLQPLVQWQVHRVR